MLKDLVQGLIFTIESVDSESLMATHFAYSFVRKGGEQLSRSLGCLGFSVTEQAPLQGQIVQKTCQSFEALKISIVFLWGF